MPSGSFIPKNYESINILEFSLNPSENLILKIYMLYPVDPPIFITEEYFLSRDEYGRIHSRITFRDVSPNFILGRDNLFENVSDNKIIFETRGIREFSFFYDTKYF